MPIYGYQSALSLVFQDSYDSVGDLTNSYTNIPYLSENLTTNLEDILSDQITGTFDEENRYRGQQHVNGDIEVEVGAASIGMLISSMLDKQSSVNSDSIYTHTWKGREGEALPLSWNKPVTIAVASNPSGASLLGVKNILNLCATSMEFTLEQGGFLKSKIAFVGGADNGGSTAERTNFISNDDLFTWDNSSLSINGVGLKSESITINVTDPVEPQFTLTQSYWPYANRLNGFRDVTFSLVLPWDNNSAYTDFFNDTNIGTLKLHAAGKTEIQSGYYNEINFDLERVRYESVEKSAGGPGEVMLNISGRAQYNDSTAYSMQITLTNSQQGDLY